MASPARLATIGLDSIEFAKRFQPRFPLVPTALAAAAAAVSHSSRRRFVTPSRTSVSPIACKESKA